MKVLSASEAIERIKSMTGDRSFWPAYDVHNGYTAWRFSDLCRRLGYERAQDIAEKICVTWRDQVGSPDTELDKTYQQFLKAELNVISGESGK
jgi:hypothetical protein